MSSQIFAQVQDSESDFYVIRKSQIQSWWRFSSKTEETTKRISHPPPLLGPLLYLETLREMFIVMEEGSKFRRCRYEVSNKS